MAKQGKKSKKAKRPAPAPLVSLEKRSASGRKAKNKRAKEIPAAGTDIPQIPADEAADDATTALARIGQLEADRTNLMAQVAWARAVAQEQQKALDVERKRTERLEADLATQRERIERLKALSLVDRLLGRHKGV